MQNTPIALESPSPNIRMRPVRLEDVPTLYQRCWEQYTSAFVQKLVSRAQHLALQGRGLGLVAVGGGQVKDLIGFGQLTLWSNCAEISDLIVAEDQRGCGVGTAIIQYLVRVARDMHIPCVEIGVAKSNPRALALYERLGFEAHKTIEFDIGAGVEPIIYLNLYFPKK